MPYTTYSEKHPVLLDAFTRRSYQVEIDWQQIERLARRAAANASRKAVRGPIRVRIVDGD